MSLINESVSSELRERESERKRGTEGSGSTRMFRAEENVLTGNDYAQNLTDKTRQKGSAHKSVGKCDLPSPVRVGVGHCRTLNVQQEQGDQAATTDEKAQDYG